MSKFKKIVMLMGDTASSRILYNKLIKSFDIVAVIQEQDVNRWRFLKNRAQKLGWCTVMGQILFQLYASTILKWEARKRIAKLYVEYDLNDQVEDTTDWIFVSSANSIDTRSILESLEPDLIIVNGTRILSSKLLKQIDAPFVNIHAGLTPWYRGVHGGYWAIANKEPERCGVTLHFVNEGVDTGHPISQTVIHQGPDDNFMTYPLLQLIAGIELLMKFLKFGQGHEVLKGSMEVGKQWYHPTLIYYLKKRIQLKIH